MGNEYKGLPNHSAEYFGDTRAHWWHADSLAMFAQNWNLDAVHNVLDVGCGIGHWGRALASVLRQDARVIGIDRDEMWIRRAAELAATSGLSSRLEYKHAVAESLPFDSGTFDLVTCQTVLMHVKDPAKVLTEMVRVVKPGGLVVTAEPNNAVPLLIDSIALGDSPELTGRLIAFQLTCERGKRACGEGCNVLGEELPRLMNGAGLEDVQIRQNDRCWTFAPPYSSDFEQAAVAETRDAVQRGLWIWDYETTRRYFLAGRGQEEDFAVNWGLAIDQRRRCADALNSESFWSAGGGVFYLAWGRRPETALLVD